MKRDHEKDNEMQSKSQKDMEKCVSQELVIKNVRLAAAYVPYQKMCNTFSPIDALKRGTAFPELFSPYDKKDKKSKLEKEDKGRDYYEE
ncbi:hypothetical protein Q428_01085 [Fervidicella metallireducens AeB]|uniref:Spore coat associated protein JA (CotJA) n=1 Tax=Fervidicella metallireducens AeB TaxID=1403537 RepID=A0A017RZ24_9CLOT|nr:spore coat associated protein CotJA [Fervidicella metallireducens]EYE89644.1 hypothetical protein Q428_01085 [Fervidicella metallireducens AeB]